MQLLLGIFWVQSGMGAAHWRPHKSCCNQSDHQHQWLPGNASKTYIQWVTHWWITPQRVLSTTLLLLWHSNKGIPYHYKLVCIFVLYFTSAVTRYGKKQQPPDQLAVPYYSHSCNRHNEVYAYAYDYHCLAGSQRPTLSKITDTTVGPVIEVLTLSCWYIWLKQYICTAFCQGLTPI